MYAACKFEFQLVGLYRGWGWWRGEGGVRGSWICGRKQVEAVDGSTFKVNGTPK